MEPTLHIAIPVALMLIQRQRFRLCLLAGLGGILPDFDVLFMAHRSVSHSLLIASIPLLLGIFLLRRRTIGLVLTATSIGWVSHVLLDFIGGLTPILWPITNYSYGLVLELQLHISSYPSILLNAKLLQEVYNYGLFNSFDAPIITAEGITLSILLILMASFRMRWK